MQFIAAIENDTVDFTRYYGDTLKVWWAIFKKTQISSKISVSQNYFPVFNCC